MTSKKPSNRATVGSVGEEIAAKYVEGIGYEIIGRNIREKFGEIDILARDRRGTLCFVEVKTISGGFAASSGMRPEDNLSGAKFAKMKKIAEWYANNNSGEVGSAGYRIDLVCVVLQDQQLTDWQKECDIKLYTNLI